jgi:DNA modification methylase
VEVQVKAESIELVDPFSLIPNPKNNNKHPKEQLERLAKIIQHQGFRRPVTVSKRSGFIVVGHARVEVAKTLGMAKVPVIYQHYDSEADEYADLTADNALQEWSEIDLSQINLDILDLGPFDVELLGLKDFEVEPLDKLDPQTDEDAVPEVEHPITRRGDVWLLGNHRLLCGDSTNPDDVNVLMGMEYPDLIHTDPPYGMNAVTKSGVLSKNYKTDIIGDDNPDVAKDAFTLIYSMYPDAKQIWWGANYYSSALPDSECWLVWDKNNGGSDQTDCELAWANFRSVVRQFTQASEKSNRVHPTQKPVSLTEWIIKRFKLTSSLIADFFGGSGSTLIAAEKNGITSRIMEFDPMFCDVIIKRWEEYTGKTATLEATGQTYSELKVERDGEN